MPHETTTRGADKEAEHFENNSDAWLDTTVSFKFLTSSFVTRLVDDLKQKLSNYDLIRELSMADLPRRDLERKFAFGLSARICLDWKTSGR